MSEISITLERSTFPLTKFYLSLGNNNFSVKPGEIKKIRLDKAGQYEIIASSFWIKKSVNLNLKDNTTLKIKHIIPDAYYLVGVAIIIILAILTFLNIVDGLVLAGCVLLYNLPLMYFSFFKRKNYFQIKTN